MTTLDEERRSLQSAEWLLEALGYPNLQRELASPDCPERVRENPFLARGLMASPEVQEIARRILRHWPAAVHLDLMYRWREENRMALMLEERGENS